MFKGKIFDYYRCYSIQGKKRVYGMCVLLMRKDYSYNNEYREA
jgi:hypothetical protein